MFFGLPARTTTSPPTNAGCLGDIGVRPLVAPARRAMCGSTEKFTVGRVTSRQHRAGRPTRHAIRLSPACSALSGNLHFPAGFRDGVGDQGDARMRTVGPAHGVAGPRRPPLPAIEYRQGIMPPAGCMAIRSLQKASKESVIRCGLDSVPWRRKGDRWYIAGLTNSIGRTRWERRQRITQVGRRRKRSAPAAVLRVRWRELNSGRPVGLFGPMGGSGVTSPAQPAWPEQRDSVRPRHGLPGGADRGGRRADQLASTGASACCAVK